MTKEDFIPSNAIVWTEGQYFDGKGWQALTDKENIKIKQVHFVDNRLLCLSHTLFPPEEIKKLLNDNYQRQSWSDGKIGITIENDNLIYIKLPFLNSVSTYTHNKRLAILLSTWKPCVFLINDNMATIRITDDLTLIVIKDENNSITTVPVPYNSGFCCIHPILKTILVHGAYALHNMPEAGKEIVPNLTSKPPSGKWDYFIFFFNWGSMIVPKLCHFLKKGRFVDMVSGERVKQDVIGLVLISNLKIFIKLDTPKMIRDLVYGEDYALTVKEFNNTLHIYLLIDGQIARMNYIIDDKTNKVNGSGMTFIKFKCDRNDRGDLIIKDDLAVNVLLSSGCPLGIREKFNLMSEQLVCIYDVEIGRYLSNKIGLDMCDALKF